MIDKIIGITGCVFGITGCVTSIIANSKIKKMSGEMTAHIKTMHDNSIEREIVSINNRLNELDKKMSDRELIINNVCSVVDDEKKTITNLENEIKELKRSTDHLYTMKDADRNDTIKYVNTRFDNVTMDLISMNNWGKNVGMAIGQLEKLAQTLDDDFKPMISPQIIDERKRSSTIPPEEPANTINTESTNSNGANISNDNNDTKNVK